METLYYYDIISAYAYAAMFWFPIGKYEVGKLLQPWRWALIFFSAPAHLIALMSGAHKRQKNEREREREWERQNHRSFCALFWFFVGKKSNFMRKRPISCQKRANFLRKKHFCVLKDNFV